MSIGIALTVFPIIFLGELPDKTMFASLVLATRGRPMAVWLGAAGAFVVHVAIATTVGVVVFRLLPHRAIEGVVGAIFFAGALLALREAAKDNDDDDDIATSVATDGVSRGRTVLTAFVVIFIAEWGDLTQILTANLAVRYHSPVSVGVGALAALWLVAAIAVGGGQGLLRFVRVATLRKATAVALFGLSAYSVWLAVR